MNHFDRPQLDIENFSEWLVLARKKLQITQEELAREIKYSAVHISNIENGKSGASRIFKERVIRLLKERGVL